MQVVEAESGGKGQAGGLRDQRDALLRELSGLVNVATREQAGGSINVYIGNDTVVQFGSARTLVAVADAAGAAGDVSRAVCG